MGARTRCFAGALGLATCALAVLPAGAGAQAPPPRSYWFSIASEPGAPRAAGSFAESYFGEAAERPTPVQACVELTRQEQGGTRKRPTSTTITEQGCGTLTLLLPYAGPGSLSGAIPAASGGELRVEDGKLTRVPRPIVGSHTYCSWADVFFQGPNYWTNCQIRMAQTIWVGVREEGNAVGTIRSTASGAVATGSGPLVSRNALTCVGPGCPK